MFVAFGIPIAAYIVAQFLPTGAKGLDHGLEEDRRSGGDLGSDERGHLSRRVSPAHVARSVKPETESVPVPVANPPTLPAPEPEPVSTLPESGNAPPVNPPEPAQQLDSEKVPDPAPKPA